MFGIKFDEFWEYDIMRKEQLSKEQLSAKEETFEKWTLGIMRSMATNRFAKVTFYPYRTARVYDVVFDAERNSMLPLEYLLAIKAGVSPDNHTVYEVYSGCEIFYIWCHDGLCRVGKSIQKGSW